MSVGTMLRDTVAGSSGNERLQPVENVVTAVVSGIRASLGRFVCVLSNTSAIHLMALLFVVLGQTEVCFGFPAIATTTTLVATSGTTVAVGTVTVLTAAVTPTSRGVVRFCLAEAPFCTGTNLLSSVEVGTTGTATFRRVLSEGTYSIRAVFSGTLALLGSSSPVQTISVVGNGVSSKFTTTEEGIPPDDSLGKPINDVPPLDSTAFLASANDLPPAESIPDQHVAGFCDAQSSPMPKLAGADVDNDGIPDLIVACGRRLTVYLGVGNGTFLVGNSYEITSDAISIKVADMNGDGNLDIVIVGSSNDFSPGYITVLLGNGDGTFQSSSTRFFVQQNPSDLALADVNRDGVPDAIVANEGSSSVSVLFGNGDGTFQTQQVFATDPGPTSIAVGDFITQGTTDIVTGTNSGRLDIFRGNGDGVFQPIAMYPEGSVPKAIVVGDFNGDGKLDVASGDCGSNTVSIFLGQGDGTFFPPISYGVTGCPYALALGDFDGNGVQDFAVAILGSGSFYYFGDGNGRFKFGGKFANYPYNTGIVVEDFEGHGSDEVAHIGLRDGKTHIILSTKTTFTPSSNIRRPLTISQPMTRTDRESPEMPRPIGPARPYLGIKYPSLMLPQVWVDNNECTDGKALIPPQYEYNMATQAWVSAPPASCPGVLFHNPYWTPGSPTFAGLQQADTDFEACRTASLGVTGFYVDMPPRFAFTGTTTNGFIPAQTAPFQASSCIVYRSTMHNSLPAGQVIGTHGTQDNLATSTDPLTGVLIHNPDATGQNMWFALGPVWSCASPPCSTANPATLSGITTVSVNTTTLCPIPNSVATTLCPNTAATGNVLVPLANGYISPTLGSSSSTVITISGGGNTETFAPQGGANQTGVIINFSSLAHTYPSGSCIVYNTTGCGGTITNGTGAFTLANGIVTNTSVYNDLQYLWTLQGQATGASFAMNFCNASATGHAPLCGSNQGPDHRMFQDMEARPYPGNGNTQDIIGIAGVASGATSTAQMAQHNHFDQDFLHADWTSVATGTNSTTDAIEFDCIDCSFMHSLISEILRPGGEHHGVTAQGQGQKINHNVIESGSIPIFAGGYSAPNPSIFGYVPNCDSEIRRNNGEWPFAWLGLSSPGNPIPAGYNPNFGNWDMVRKNGYENKSACRIVVEGNIFGGLDNSGSQEGAAIALDVRNSSNGLGNANYQATLQDVTISKNIFRHYCSGPVFQNSGYLQGGGVAYQEQRILFSNNLLYDQGQNNYQCTTASGMEMNGTGGTWQGFVTILGDGEHARFTAICNADDIQQTPIGTVGGCPGQILPSGVMLVGGSCSGRPTITFGTPNIAGGNHATGRLTCSGTSFVLTMTNYGTGYTSAATATVTCPWCASLPTVTVAPLTLSNYVPVSNSIGFEVFDIVPGQPVAITQCQNRAFNTVGVQLYQNDTYLPETIGPSAWLGSAAWSGSFDAAGVSVTFPLWGNPGTSELSGYCKLTTIQGGPGNNIQWIHNTVVSNSLHQITAANGINNIISDGPNFQTQALIQNSIFVGGSDGWCNNPIGCGNPTIAFDFDTLNTATIDHLVWPGPSLVDIPYTAFGVNPLFPVASPTMYFPGYSFCAGPAPTSECVGFVGAMNVSSMPLNLGDYHGYELMTGSAFKSGDPQHKHQDGTDMGPNIPEIDSAMTQNVFVCPYYCGQQGPYPDVAEPDIPESIVLLRRQPVFRSHAFHTDSSQSPW